MTDPIQPGLDEDDKRLIECVRANLTPIPYGPERVGLAPFHADENFIHRLIKAARAEAAETISTLRAELEEARAKLNAPELHDFAAGVVLEAAHQRERWAANHDVGKAPEDWFWLLGWLSGKAVHAARSGDLDKAKHHTISSAAALANWHAALSGQSAAMRPGIDPKERGYV